MYCMKCGASVDPHNKFCSSCGTKVIQFNEVKKSNPWLDKPGDQQKTVFKTQPIVEKEEKSGGFFKKWRFYIFVSIAFFIFSLARKDLIHVVADNEIHPDTWALATEQYKKIKTDQNLPVVVDQYTTFKDMYVEDRKIHYVYTVKNLAVTEELKSELYTMALKMFNENMCQNPLITQHGGQLILSYQFITDTLNYEFDKSFCLKK
ncbi:zinc ribbon domain-containing protein [Yersinia rochesterensis]|uniref:zinc ribbon domain-containing protein n=1 Tax=Yersinia rochesterensis TaxID=1604335 RepID=UPI001643C77E|nr:zinc ribbon domain-containing protein [Yersinia rochesterensis]